LSRRPKRLYESHHEPLLPRRQFYLRLAGHAGAALALVAFSLAMGMAIYMGFEGLPWLDAFLNASMLLGGMGPVAPLQTPGGKLFAGLYALYSGLIVLVAAGIVGAPVIHRVMHRFQRGADGRAALRRYYASRAHEYEAIYRKPERQADLERLRSLVAAFGEGRRVLEIACGTGYWTVPLASAAVSLTATDVSDEVLDVARSKPLPPGIVTFAHADAFGLEALPGRFDAAFAGFWWSHVLRADLKRFLAGLHARLERPARVLLLDNRYVEGSSTPVSRTDDAGNTYQERSLADGARHEVLKNFPSPAQVRKALAGTESLQVAETPYFWQASYELRQRRHA
jgi:demethylmenaquinone methyltransferase/2-methoxy-6-polyprenyl-1,4-benzoquinol methylase